MIEETPKTKPWFLSKTIIANMITAILALGNMLFDLGYIDPETGWIALAISFLNTALRWVTKEPISLKTSK